MHHFLCNEGHWQVQENQEESLDIISNVEHEHGEIQMNQHEELLIDVEFAFGVWLPRLHEELIRAENIVHVRAHDRNGGRAGHKNLFFGFPNQIP